MTDTPMLAWHNDPALKADAVARMTAHRAQDELVQGTYAALAPGRPAGYHGCFHGCLTLETVAAERGETISRAMSWMDGQSYHEQTERLWGIPRPLGRLLDAFFEGVDPGYAGEWAVAVTEAIPVGADLSLVVAHMMRDLMVDVEQGVRRHTAEGSEQRAAVDLVAGLYARLLAGESVERDEWVTARRAADVADVAAAADVAAYAAAAYAAAAYAAAYAADAYAAAYAADAAAYAAAYADHRRWRADRLIHHIRTAPIPVTIT